MTRYVPRLLLITAIITLMLAVFWFSTNDVAGNKATLIKGRLGLGGKAMEDGSAIEQLQAPPGFRLEIFARDLPRPRMMAVTNSDDLLFSSPGEGSVYLLKTTEIKPEPIPLVTHLNRPHGLAIHKGWLYIAETDALGRIAFNAASETVTGDYQRLVSGLPSGGHSTRTVKVGPDNRLYLSVGSSCNVCIEKDKRRAAILRYDLDGKHETVYATGLRNSVGFDWAPWSGEMYATNNGRDWLGDNFPPEELNRIVEDGFYGWPYLNGDNQPDPDYGDKLPDNLDPITPAHTFPAHNAPLGIHFLNSKHLPDKYAKTALVALHGSWNRSVPDGYKVVTVSWTDNGIKTEDFLTGFLHPDNSVIGRPVDIVTDNQGRIYISDDYARAIYRLTWEGMEKPASQRLDNTP